jgi:hypothetical protein
MVAGIEGEGGEGSKCESMERIYFLNSSVNIVWKNFVGWSYKVKKAFSGEKMRMLRDALNVHRTYKTTSYVSCKGYESERRL